MRYLIPKTFLLIFIFFYSSLFSLLIGFYVINNSFSISMFNSYFFLYHISILLLSLCLYNLARIKEKDMLTAIANKSIFSIKENYKEKLKG